MTEPVTGGAITVGCFEWVAHLVVCRYLDPAYWGLESRILQIDRAGRTGIPRS
jgi:hypothetical protein